MSVLSPCQISTAKIAPPWRRYRHGLRFLPLYLMLAIFFVFPVIMLVVGAFRSSVLSQNAQWTLHAFTELFSPAVGRAFGISAVLAIGSTLIGLSIALALAFVAERSDARTRRLIMPAMMLVYATPVLFYTTSFSVLANPYTGLINDLARVLGADAAMVDIESLWGMVLVTALRVAAFGYLFLAAGFRAIDRNLEDAAVIAGQSRLKAILQVDLPLLAPALTGAALITLVAGIHTFDIALILGEPAGLRTVATEIYHITSKSLPPDFASASLIGTIVLIIGAGLGYAQYRLLGGRSFTTVQGKAANDNLLALGRARLAVDLGVLAYLGFAAALPFALLVYTTLQPFPGTYDALTLRNFTRILAAPETRVALGNTLTLSVSVGAVVAALAFWIASSARQMPTRAAGIVRQIVTLPFALPGVVAAIAITAAFISVPGLAWLYGSLTLMALALMVVSMPISVQMAGAALAQIAPELTQAAILSGSNRLRTFRTITLPLVARSFAFIWFITGVSVAGALDVPLLLGGAGLTTVSTRVYDLSLQGKMGQAAALLVLLVGIAAVVFAIVWSVHRLLLLLSTRTKVTLP